MHYTAAGNPGGELSEDDKAALAGWVNPAYLEQGAWSSIQPKFKEDGSVQLHGFLVKERAEEVLKVGPACLPARPLALLYFQQLVAVLFLDQLPGSKCQVGRSRATAWWPTMWPTSKLGHCFILGGRLLAWPLQAILAADEEDKLGRKQVPAYNAGIGEGWKPVGPCHKQRYLRYEGGAEAPAEGASGKAAAGALLARIQKELFASGAFARLVKQVGGRELKSRFAGSAVAF